MKYYIMYNALEVGDDSHLARYLKKIKKFNSYVMLLEKICTHPTKLAVNTGHVFTLTSSINLTTGTYCPIDSAVCDLQTTKCETLLAPAPSHMLHELN